MPWCPKCTTEYEEGVSQCADCHVQLVESTEEIVDWVLIIKAKLEEDARNIVEYLKYSGIEKTSIEKTFDDENTLYKVLVASEDVEKAYKYLKAYLISKAEENEDSDEYVLNEYETENFDQDAIISDLKSSVFTFGIIGIGLLIFSILSFLDIISINLGNRYIFSVLMFIISIVFILVALNSRKKISQEMTSLDNKEEQINTILKWFKGNLDLDYFIKKYELNVNEFDEGALYYVLMDKIKEEISRQFKDYDNKIINSAAEQLYEQIVK